MSRLAVLYDEACGFCRWSVAQLLALDRRGALRPVAIQSEEGARLLSALAPERRLLSAHVVTPEGRLLSGGDAAAPIAAVLPAGAPVAALLRAAGPLPRLPYRLVARNRMRLGRLVTPAMRVRADELLARRGGGAAGGATAPEEGRQQAP